MPLSPGNDAIVVGSGPNGLAAAITLTQAGLKVLLLEASSTIGGGTRSEELTLPGFIHDICSAIHPMALGSPFFRDLQLDRHGLRWIHPEFPLTHPLADGKIAILHPSITETAKHFNRDARAYERLFEPLVANWRDLATEFLQPIIHLPRHPILLARFGLLAMRSGASLIRSRFKDESAQALLIGLCCHSFLPIERVPSAAIGLVLGIMGHAVGWPMPEGGSRNIGNALASRFLSLGGKIEVNHRVQNLDEVKSSARVILLDVTPRQFLRLAGDQIHSRSRRAFERFRYGPAVFKIDYALSDPIPWTSPHCAKAGTVHLGGTFEEIAFAEREVTAGRHPDRPFMILTQPTLFDKTRAPIGKHTAWAYCHVPHGSTADMTQQLESQIERFAPGFRECILARHTMDSKAFEQHNPNLVGGDINGGLADLRQIIARPVLSPVPYRTPLKGVYLCSASTPPGGGVHGMCGHHAARAAVNDWFR